MDLPNDAADLTAETPPEKIPPTVRKIPPTALLTPLKIPDAAFVTPENNPPTAPPIDFVTDPKPTAFVILGKARNKKAIMCKYFVV
jgi:hypothetical protein